MAGSIEGLIQYYELVSWEIKYKSRRWVERIRHTSILNYRKYVVGGQCNLIIQLWNIDTILRTVAQKCYYFTDEIIHSFISTSFRVFPGLLCFVSSLHRIFILFVLIYSVFRHQFSLCVVQSRLASVFFFLRYSVDWMYLPNASLSVCSYLRFLFFNVSIECLADKHNKQLASSVRI